MHLTHARMIWWTSQAMLIIAMLRLDLYFTHIHGYATFDAIPNRTTPN